MQMNKFWLLHHVFFTNTKNLERIFTWDVNKHTFTLKFILLKFYTTYVPNK